MSSRPQWRDLQRRQHMAIALSKEKVQAQHGLMIIYSFIALMLTNVVVLMIVNALFPHNVVLGTYSISYWWAICHSMLRLTLIGVFAMLLVTVYEWKNKLVFTSKQWMITYLVVNFLALWCISRFADNLGLGVSSWWIVLFLAIVFDWAQGMVMMALEKRLK